MPTRPKMVMSLLRLPSGYLPVMMSLTAMTLVLGTITADGPAARQPDEGTAAHLFQLLIAAQLPILAFFAVRHGPRDPAAASAVLSLHLFAVALALLPVWWCRL